MKKIYCDECDDEITDIGRVKQSIVLRIDYYGEQDGEMGTRMDVFLSQDLCSECVKKARTERKWVSL